MLRKPNYELVRDEDTHSGASSLYVMITFRARLHAVDGVDRVSSEKTEDSFLAFVHEILDAKFRQIGLGYARVSRYSIQL